MRREINSAEFSARLREVLREKELTRNQAAERLGIPGSQLSRYLNGQLPDLRMLYKLAQWSSHTMEWLLIGDREIGPSFDTPEALGDKLDRAICPEWGHLTEIEQLCKKLDTNTLLAVQRLLESIRPVHSCDATLKCLRALTDLLELERKGSSIPSQRAAKLLQFFRDMYIEKLSHSDLAALWDALGRRLYSRREPDLSSQSYPAFVRNLATQCADDDHQKTAQAVKQFNQILSKVRKQSVSPSNAIKDLISIGETFPQSPLIASRSNWRKSAAFKDQLKKRIGDAISHSMSDQEWKKFCQTIRLQLLGK